MSRSIILALLCALLTAGTVNAQTSDETCSLPELEILFDTPVVDTLSGLLPMVIEETRVFVDISHTFIGDLDVIVTSPAGTEVPLFVGAGESDIDLIMWWDDSGVGYMTDTSTCGCDMEVVGPEILGDFTGERSDGTWSLYVYDDFDEDDGKLNEWCVEVIGCGDVEPITEFECEITEDGFVLIKWYGFGYEEFEIYRDGDLIYTADFDEEEYKDEDAEPGPHTYCVRGIDEDDDCQFEICCQVELGRKDYCWQPGLEIEPLLRVSDSITVPDDFDSVSQVQIHVEMRFPLQSDLVIEVENPEGTLVKVHDQTGGGSDFYITYDDLGVANGTDSYDCYCHQQPAFDAMVDLVPVDEDGDWTIWIENFSDVNEGTLDYWCVSLFGVEGVSDVDSFFRGDADNDGNVFPIIDGLYILQWGFNNGPAPECRGAADVDDSGDLFPILDTLFLLDYGFNNGPPPPDPGPTNCGPDDTDDELDCEEPAC